MEVGEAVAEAVASDPVPGVVDADGLRAVSTQAEETNKRKSRG